MFRHATVFLCIVTVYTIRQFSAARPCGAIPGRTAPVFAPYCRGSLTLLSRSDRQSPSGSAFWRCLHSARSVPDAANSLSQSRSVTPARVASRAMSSIVARAPSGRLDQMSVSQTSCEAATSPGVLTAPVFAPSALQKVRRNLKRPRDNRRAEGSQSGYRARRKLCGPLDRR